LYKKWWGNLKNNNVITIIETESGSGGQTDETTILLPGEAFADKNNSEYLFHEISHLWNVLIKESISSSRWEEGLATFSQYLAAEKMNIKDAGYVNRITDNRIKYLGKALKSNSKLAQTPLFLFGKEGLTDFSYTQGMIMFSILYSWLGEETFNKVIRNFYRDFYETGASIKDFTDLWCKVGKPKNIKAFFEDWMYTTRYADLIEKYGTLDSLVEYYRSNKK
jgi:aminopeptidase N